jgi:type VI secretion system secreted protein Hcp
MAKHLFGTVALALAVAIPAQSIAAFDAFLRLDGIDGESTDAQHKNEIVIDGWSLGASNRLASTGQPTSSRPCFSDISLVKHVDKASPVLFQYAVNGKHIPTAVITVRKRGENPVEYLTLTLTDVLISSVSSTSTDGADAPAESISFNFQAILISYTPQSSDGTPQRPVQTTSKGSC